MSSKKPRVLVLGYIVRRPLGGGTWPTLQYVLGLQRLGYDVYFVEDSDDYGTCYDPSRHVTDEDPTFGLNYAKSVFERVGLAERWLYYDAPQRRWHGARAETAETLCRSAELLLNNSGINRLREWTLAVPRRAFIDTDPGFEQIRFLTESDRRRHVLEHNVFFTLGEKIPTGATCVPETGIPWQATRQPVVLDQWPVTPVPLSAPFTTVMLWDSYATRSYGDLHLGMKSQSFDPYFALPSRVRHPLELAVGSAGAPRARLREHGYRVADPLAVTADPWTYQRYLSGSLGEFTVAKHGYVETRSGWFSERSAHYLASGRPVITQDTGFRDLLPTGEGLHTFSSLEEAVAAIESVLADPQRQGTLARDVAAAHFHSDQVLTRLVERAMSSTLPVVTTKKSTP